MPAPSLTSASTPRSAVLLFLVPPGPSARNRPSRSYTFISCILFCKGISCSRPARPVISICLSLPFRHQLCQCPSCSVSRSAREPTATARLLSRQTVCAGPEQLSWTAHRAVGRQIGGSTLLCSLKAALLAQRPLRTWALRILIATMPKTPHRPRHRASDPPPPPLDVPQPLHATRHQVATTAAVRAPSIQTRSSRTKICASSAAEQGAMPLSERSPAQRGSRTACPCRMTEGVRRRSSACSVSRSISL